MSCDVGEVTKIGEWAATEGLENELWRRWSDANVGEWAELILQLFRHFTYITPHSPTLPLLHLRHSSFSNPYFVSPTSQALHLIHLTSLPWSKFVIIFSYNNKLPSVVTHDTRIREVPGSNPGADQPGWGFFVVFLSHQGKCWVVFSLPRSIWPKMLKYL